MAKLIWDKKTQQYIDVEDINNLSYAEKSYKLKSNKDEVEEGDSVQITLSTSNVDAGTVIPFVVYITGRSSSNIVEPLSGNFTISSIDSAFEGSDTLTFNVIADNLTERRETMILSLVDLDASIQISLLDTSKTPEADLPSYSLSSNADSLGEVDEGDAMIFTLETSNVPDGKQPYTISGIDEDDLSAGSLSGNFTISNDSSGDSSSSVSITLKEDVRTERKELVILSLSGRSEKVEVKINDTSISPTFALSSDKDTVKGNQTITFTLTTTNVPDGTLVPYEFSNLKPSDISTLLDSYGDLVDSAGNVTLSVSGNSISGNFIVSGNQSQREITISDIKYVRKTSSLKLKTGEKISFNMKK
tara:strand:+ start:6274 stop:7353 length:1080 start_codon:yes stop_codon:yes gene_type:complete